MKYTYDDIVTAKDILAGNVKKEDIIGKKGWFLDVIPSDMSLNYIIRLAGNPRVLGGINCDESYPFADNAEISDDYHLYFLPEKEPPYEERQAEWIKENDIKVGDKVKILRGFEPYERGVGTRMDSDHYMDNLIGTISEVSNIEPNRISVWSNEHGQAWSWPYFVLEKVEDKPTYTEPEYIPFDLSLEEDRDALRDKWIKSTNPDVFQEFKITQFIRMDDDHQTIYAKAGFIRYSGNDLFYDYMFADGSPVGKLANGQQITSK